MNEEPEHTSVPVRMLHEAASVEPDDTRFALLVTLRAQGGYGRSMVLWFASVSTLSWFLLDAFPEVFCGEDATEELLETLGSLMPVLREEGLTQAVLDELNEYTGAWATLEWLGTLDDLCAADTESTKKIIAWFREDRRQDGDEPVTEEERRDLAEFLTGLNDF